MFISGEAGTGKSVLLSSTFNAVQQMANGESEGEMLFRNTNNYLLVNHSEMLKTYHSIADSIKNLHKVNIVKPTTFINNIDKGKYNIEKANIVFIDEAHLLLSKKDTYNSFHFDNQLDEIIKRADIVICMYDEKQVLKLKSYWDEKLLKKIKKNYKHKDFKLNEQFRIKATDETLQWIDNFVGKKVTKIPLDDNYEIKVFATLKEMHEAIKKRNKEHGISRVVSTFDYKHKKDNKDYFVEDNNFKLLWNRSYRKTWAEVEETIEEVGSIYTIQGFDLNYVGVHIGPSITLNTNTMELEIDTKKYCDTEAYRKNELIPNNKLNITKEKIILNSLNVLMKRGVRGLYIHAWDKNLNDYLMKNNYEHI